MGVKLNATYLALSTVEAGQLIELKRPVPALVKTPFRVKAVPVTFASCVEGKSPTVKLYASSGTTGGAVTVNVEAAVAAVVPPPSAGLVTATL